MKNLDAIRESDIASALTMDDLDDACAYLQGIAGSTDGGVAAVCFSKACTGNARPAITLSL